MNYTIRKAVLEDSADINNLLTLLIRDEKKYDSNINENCVVKRLYENIIPNNSNFVLVAESNNKIIGYLFGYIIDNGDAYLEKTSKLEAVYVIDEFRKKGVATSLIKEFKLWSLKNNVKYIEVQVLNDNTNAINLYNENGFKKFKSTLRTQIEEEISNEIE